MNLDKNIISRLENLSMLSLSDKEREALLPELEKMVEMLIKIQKADFSTKESNTQKQVLRADDEKPNADFELIKQNSKQTKDNYFVVPKVIKKTNG